MQHRPVIERLTVRNYRVLREIAFRDLTPLTVLFGPNGSGKSTVFDVFAFLHEAFTTNLRSAWDARGRMDQIRSRGSDGTVSIEISYRGEPEAPGERSRLVTYLLELGEVDNRVVVEREILRWNSAPKQGRPQHLLDFSRGKGSVYDEVAEARTSQDLDSPDLLAVSTLGQLTRHPRVVALRRFISGWYLSYVSANAMRDTTTSGPQERLTEYGGNLPNVVQYLQEQHPERLERIFEALRNRVPGLERLVAEPLQDGRLLLALKDHSFGNPILSRFTSDGTLKLLAYLTILYDPNPPTIVGIEEPENQLHPRLLAPLAEEMRAAAEHGQLVVTTHSPYLADALVPKELWLVYRAEDGFARTMRASQITAVTAMHDSGGRLGDLWMEGYFGAGDPLKGRNTHG